MTLRRYLACPKCGTEVETFKNPKPTIDIIIAMPGGGVVLIHRKNEPKKWAIPGGFVDYGESLETAAVREAREETGLDVRELKQFHAYSDPSRDTRSHNISVVFTGRGEGVPAAASDADGIGVFTKDDLPDLAFDHAVILEDYFSGRY